VKPLLLPLADSRLWQDGWPLAGRLLLLLLLLVVVVRDVGYIHGRRKAEILVSRGSSVIFY